MKYFATIGETIYEVKVAKNGSVTVNGEAYDVTSAAIGPNTRSMLIGNKSYETVVVGAGDPGTYEVAVAGEHHAVLVQDELTYRVAQAQEAAAANMGEVTIKSPMPGLILNVPVTVGETVSKGQTLVILESMKMENELKSPRDGIVLKVSTEASASVEKGQALVTVGDAEQDA